MAEATLSETEAKLKELQRFRDGLVTKLKQWKLAPKGKVAAEFCALIENA